MPPEKEIDHKDDLLVELDDDQLGLFDTPKTEVVVEDKPKRAKKVVAPVADDDAVEVLKKRYETTLETERQARLAAEKRAADREAELETARKRQTETEGDVISNAKAAAQSAADSIEKELAKAWEDGEYAKASQLQRKLARAEASLLSLDNQEADHKERVSTPPAEPAKKADTPAASSDLEAFIAQMTPKMKAWFREHPDAFHDEELRHTAFAADKAAQKQRITFDSDDYYNFINKRLGFDEPDDEGDDDVEEDTPRRAAAAPVSREAPRTGTRRNGEVRGEYLTAEERAFCNESGVSYKEYAAEKLNIKKGKYA